MLWVPFQFFNFRSVPVNLQASLHVPDGAAVELCSLLPALGVCQGVADGIMASGLPEPVACVHTGCIVLHKAIRQTCEWL